MQHELLVRLKPLEPYFFGGERTFKYEGINMPNSGGYFIRSLITPSQTTLMGILRYLGLRAYRGEAWMDDSRRADIIGADSYNLLCDPQKFGMIERISPLFLLDDAGSAYIRTPMDHVNGKGKQHYTPWVMPETEMPTNAGNRSFPNKCDYDDKFGLADSWLKLDDLSIVEGAYDRDKKTGIFLSVIRVGVNKRLDVDGLFQQEFFYMPRHSFAFFAKVDEGFLFDPQVVYMGQDKSPFEARIVQGYTKEQFDRQTEKFADALRPNTAYALSDWYIPDGHQTDALDRLYGACSFVCAQSRNYRVFTTKYDAPDQTGRFHRGDTLIRLIRAGSVFSIRDASILNESLRIHDQDAHAQVAGFNAVLKGKGLT